MADYKSNNTYKTLKNGYQIFTTNHTNVTRENYDSTQNNTCIKRGFKCKPRTDTCCASTDFCAGEGIDSPMNWCIAQGYRYGNNVCDPRAPPDPLWNPKGGCTFNNNGSGGTACSACCKKPPMPPGWTGELCDKCWEDAVNAGKCK